MNDHATRSLNAAAAGQEVMASNSAIWNTRPAIVDKNDALDQTVDDITLLDDQITNGSGTRTAKTLARQNAAILALKIGKPMSIFAKDTNNLELFGEIDLPWSLLRYGKDQDCIDRWQLIHDRSFTHQTALVTDGYIESTWTGLLFTAITDFGTLRGKPKAKRSNVKALNLAINLKLKELETIKADLLDLIVQFKDTEPLFYNALRAAFELDQTGMRHLALRLRYTDQSTGIRLFGVQATIQEIGLSRVSSKNGIVSFSRQELATGNYILQSELANYDQSLIENLGIDHKKLITLDISLQKGGTSNTTGTIKGTVRQMGNLVADATISVQGQPISTITDIKGEFTLPNLNPGNLNVTATLPPAQGSGIQSKTVSLSAGQNLLLNFEF
jgi:hypothetical protein